jgi:REP element-mobilizing transposase RayT
MSHTDYKPAYRRHLPHIQPPGAVIFATFRLHGALTKTEVAERQRMGLRIAPQPRWLALPETAQLVHDAILFQDNKRCDVLAFVEMPTHVHLLYRPLPSPDGSWHSMAQIMQSIKAHSGRKANMMLGLFGPFWQHESHDHYVRNMRAIPGFVRYIANDPVRAGLVECPKDWPWTYISEAKLGFSLL